MAAGRRIGRYLKIALTAVAAAAAGVVLLLVAISFVIHTPPGRALIKAQAEREIGDYLHGEVEIGSLTGSVPGRFALHDVEVIDERGVAVGRAERVSIESSPLALLRRHIVLDRVRVESPVVSARIDEEARLNLVEILDPPPPDPEVIPWDVTVADLEVARGEVDVAVVGAKVASISDIALRGAFRQIPAHEVIVRPPEEPARPDEELWIDLAHFEAELSLPDPAAGTLELEGRGRFHQEREVIEARDIRLRAGESFVEISDLEGDERGHLRGAAAAFVRAADVGELLPEIPWIGDVELAGTIERDHAEAPISIPMAGAVAGAPTHLFATAFPDPLRADLEIEVSQFNPRAAVRGAPPGALEIALHAAARDQELPGPTATAEVSAVGRLAGQRLDRAALSAELDDAMLTAEGAFDAPGGSARADALITLADEEPELAEGSLTFSIEDIPALTGQAIEARGRAQGSFRAAGVPGELTLRGEIRGRGLRYKDAAADALRVRVALARFPSAPRGGAAIDLRGIEIADERISRAEAHIDYREDGEVVEVDLSAGSPEEPYGALGNVLIDLSGEVVRAHVPQLRVRTREITWHADGTSLSIGPDDEIRIDRFQLASGAGRIAAEGVVRGREAGEVEARIDDLDLARIRRAFAPGAPPVQGTMRVHSHVHWHPERGDLRGEVDDLTMPLLTAIDLDFDVEIADERVVIALSTLGDDGELLEVEVEASAPAPLYDIDEWTELGLDAIEELALRIAGVEIISMSEPPAPQRAPLALGAQ